MKTKMAMGSITQRFNENDYEEMIISTDMIFQDGSYQRPIDYSRVKKIADDFNPLLVNMPKLSYRDGRYWVFDGQHTIAVLKLRNGNRDVSVKCKVYNGLTQQDEATLFYLQNGLSRPVPTIQKARARFTAGETEMVELVKAIHDCGIKFDFTSAKADNKIICCATVEKIFRKTKTEQFKEILSLIKESWCGDAESFNREIIGGMYIFWKVYRGEYNHSKAVDRFGRVTPIKVIGEGKQFNTLKGDARYAMALVREYNRGSKGREYRLDENEIWRYR